MSVASRVADELEVRLGDVVGFHVRFQAQFSEEKTKILYMTDGMLLREAANDPNLSKYSVIVVDEAHERTVDTDIVLSLMKLISKKRPDLRVVVMSATLDMEKFQQFFGNAPILKVPGRMYPVSLFYTDEPVRDYIAAAIEQVLQIHQNEPNGDILVFLTGEAEIDRAVSRTLKRLEELSDGADLGRGPSSSLLLRAKVLALYGSMQLEEQSRVFLPAGPNERKIIFATNIAETSITIDGVAYVVDSGYSKQSLYDPKARIDCLLPTIISKASADQRRGRAGRTRAGKCYRLFCERDLPQLPDQTFPEILRSNLEGIVLTLLQIGANPAQFPFVDAPTQQGILDAYMQLSYYGALDEDTGAITEFGKAMADFPLPPHVSRMLLKAPQYKCAIDVAAIAAIFQAGPLFFRPANPQRQGDADQQRLKFFHPDGDFLTALRVFQSFHAHHKSASFCADHYVKYTTLCQVQHIFEQIIRILRRKDLPLDTTYEAQTKTVNSPAIRKALLEGYFNNVAMLPEGAETYRSLKERQVARLHGHSTLAKSRPVCLLYERLELHGKEGAFIRTASLVDPLWLLDVHPDFFQPEEFEGAVGTWLREVRRAWDHHRATATQQGGLQQQQAARSAVVVTAEDIAAEMSGHGRHPSLRDSF